MTKCRAAFATDDVSNQEYSYLYLLATKRKMLANEIANGSFLAHDHGNKKKYKARRINQVNKKEKSR